MQNDQSKYGEDGDYEKFHLTPHNSFQDFFALKTGLFIKRNTLNIKHFCNSNAVCLDLSSVYVIKTINIGVSDVFFFK